MGQDKLEHAADNLEREFKTSHVEDEDSDDLNDSLDGSDFMDEQQDITRLISEEPPTKRKRHTPSRVLHNISQKSKARVFWRKYDHL